MFLDTLMYQFKSQKELRLTDFCHDLNIQHHLAIKKQSLDTRFNHRSVAFTKSLFEKALICLQQKGNCNSIFKEFKTVRVKDSTSFELPENLIKHFPGNSGKSSKSGIAIQFEYNLKDYQISDFSLHSKQMNDHIDARNSLESIESGDLIIRDLGYISVGNMQQISKRGAFFINRLSTQTAIYRMVDDNYIKLSYREIIDLLKESGKQHHTETLYIGSGKYFPCRAVFSLIPKDKLQKRKDRQIRKTIRRGSKSMDKQVREALELNVFVTNTTESQISYKRLYQAYKLRWQIELVFKTWKQIGKINQLKQVRPERLLTIIYAQLLWIVLNWSIIKKVSCTITNQNEKLLSLYKCFKTMKLLNNIQREAVFKIKSINRFLQLVKHMLTKSHFIEKRKGNISSITVMEIFTY